MAYAAKRDGELEAVLGGLQTKHAGQQRRPGERHRLTRSLSTYALVNALLVAIWSITTGYKTGWSFVTFWPIWSIVGWGFAVAMQALHYSSGDRLQRRRCWEAVTLLPEPRRRDAHPEAKPALPVRQGEAH